MSPARRVKAAARLAQQIVQTIYDAHMRPGDKYLSEAEGLRVHNVARGTYREALRFLEIQGVLDIRSGSGGGPVITRPDWINLASTLALLLQFSDAPMQTLLEARTAIEPGMADLAAANATEDDIAAMAQDLDEIEEHLGNYRRFVGAYLRYWDHLAQSTHNPVFAFLSPAMRAIVDSAGFVPNELYRAETLGRLRTIHASIAGHDRAAAHQAMRNLELEFLNRLTTGYPRQMQRVVAWSDLDMNRQRASRDGGTPTDERGRL